MTDERDFQQAQSIARIETLVGQMHDRLFGNGQPGALDKLDARLNKIEAIKAQSQGALYVLYALVTGLAGWLGIHIHLGK